MLMTKTLHWSELYYLWQEY